MTLYIIIVTCIISIIAFQNDVLRNKLIFAPYQIIQRNEYYRFITSGFLHGDWIHLLVNMLVLYSFGGVVEQYYKVYFEGKSTYYYLFLYFGALIISDLSSFFKHKENYSYLSLGASGAVSAVIFSYVIFQPWAMLYIWGILPIPGIVFAVLYLIYSAYYAKKGGGNINHDAHLYGAIFGFLYTILLKPKLIIFFFENLNIF